MKYKHISNMSKSFDFSSMQNSLGKKVCIKRTKYGTLRYFGNVHFAEGLWCGIELDEAVGENDGMVNNIHYFICKKNCGIFIPASETAIMANNASEIDLKTSATSIPEELSNTDFKLQNYNVDELSLDSSESVLSKNSSQKNALNESYTISKKYNTNKLTVIFEETFESVKPLYDSFSFLESKGNFSQCKKPLLVKQDIKQATSQFINSENVVSHEKFEESYESDDSLGILPHLLDDKESVDELLNDVDVLTVDLNTTANLSNNDAVFNNCCIVAPELNSDKLLLTSSICNMPNLISFTKSDESPVQTNISTPMFASTPVHETNYSYIFDEEALHSMQKFSYSFQSSKMILEKEKTNENHPESTQSFLNNANSECILPITTNVHIPVADKNAVLKENILNITCDIFNSLDIDQSPLNKTFNKLDVKEECILPVIKNNDELSLSTVDVQKDCNSLIQHISSKDVGVSDMHEAQENVCFENQNILNVTCDIIKPSNLERKENVEITENVINILNTTLSYPKELNNKSQSPEMEKDIVMHEKTEILNATYEKIDEPSELLTNIETLHPSEQYATNCNENVRTSSIGIKNKSKNCIPFSRLSLSSLKEESKNKCSMLEKKENQRKSVGCFGKSNAINTEFKNKEIRNRRKSFTVNSNKSSKFNETVIVNSSHDKSFSAKCPTKESTVKSSIGHVKGSVASKSVNITENICMDASLKLKFSSGSTEGINLYTDVGLKNSQETLLNETINLAPPVPVVAKTVVKKPRSSVNVSRKSSIAMSELPLSKTKIAIPSFKSEKKSHKPSVTAKKEVTETLKTILSKTDLKPSVNSVESVEKHKFSRIPEKHVLTEKNNCKSIPSSSRNASNRARPQSIIPVVKATNNKGVSQTLHSRKSGCHLNQNVNLNDTILISNHQNTSKISIQSACITGTAASSTPFRSRIPCVSQGIRKQDRGVKSSVIPRTTESTIQMLKKSSRYNLR